ncbi:uncharacterized protein LOC134829781 [Culicoides brevitarsis]|uniref:uncharacterized protein LOC134829781 n=1 Tax=Culicoides brevitarsis TaxID=469753 RepID=UPI00307B8E7E
MSDDSFTGYRKKAANDTDTDVDDKEDAGMEVDEKPKLERKWYKHVYKSSLRKSQVHNRLGYQNKRQQSRPQQRMDWKMSNQEDRKPLFDLRSRTIDRNRRDNQLQKDYVTNLSKLYFPKATVDKTFVIAVDRDERREVQMRLNSNK